MPHTHTLTALFERVNASAKRWTDTRIRRYALFHGKCKRKVAKERRIFADDLGISFLFAPEMTMATISLNPFNVLNSIMQGLVDTQNVENYLKNGKNKITKNSLFNTDAYADSAFFLVSNSLVGHILQTELRKPKLLIIVTVAYIFIFPLHNLHERKDCLPHGHAGGRCAARRANGPMQH